MGKGLRFNYRILDGIMQKSLLALLTIIYYRVLYLQRYDALKQFLRDVYLGRWYSLVELNHCLNHVKVPFYH